MDRTYIGTRVPMTVERWVELGWTAHEAACFMRDLAGVRETAVIVVHDGTAGPLRHHVRHSPTGFEWGYGGSGPADLARCVLIDFLDLHEEAERDPELLLGLSYQEFKFAVIAELDRAGFVLPGERIADWVAGAR